MQKQLPPPLQSVGAWIMDFHIALASLPATNITMVSSGCTNIKWASTTVGVMDTLIALSGITSQKSQHGLWGNMGHGHPYVPWWQPSPQTSTWTPVAAYNLDSRMIFGGNTGHKHQHDPLCRRTLDPDMGFGSSTNRKH